MSKTISYKGLIITSAKTGFSIWLGKDLICSQPSLEFAKHWIDKQTPDNLVNKKACLFQNGLRDLAECGEALEEDGISDLHGDELRCAIKLIQMCRDIAEQFEGVDIEALWNPPDKKPPAASMAERRRQQKLKEA